MIKKGVYYKLAIFSIWVMTALVACKDEFVENSSIQEVPEGYKLISFTAEVPDMVERNTRAIDADGGGIQELWLFCFTEDGYFLSTAKAEITPDGNQSGINSLSGSYKALVPVHTKIVHYIANYRMDMFDETLVLGKHETELIPSLVVSSGFMIYWKRMELTSGNNNVKQDVTLIRNQARFQLTNNAKEYIQAFAVYNTMAYGTVAPYQPSSADINGKFSWDSTSDATTITLPADKDLQMRLQPMEEPNNMASYIFETENTEKNPVSLVLKGNDEKYYRAYLMDDTGNFLNVRRNFSYNINVKGALENGSTTWQEALKAPAVNNVWLSIADNVRTISDGEHELSVENTVFAYETGTTNNVSIEYKYGRVSGTGDVTQPEIKWLENNEVGTGLNSTFTQSGGKGKGEITFNLNTLTEKESVRTATILVKSGMLQRNIRIYLIKKFDFTPAWVSTQVDAEKAGEPVTLMFTIPEDFPEELFPFDVKIGADWLNVRESAGQVLSIITPLSHPEDFPAGDSWTFKFVYRAQHTGVQRVYFNTTLPPNKITGGYEKADVTIEAEHFNKMDKAVSFNISHNFLSLSQLLAIDGSSLGGEMPKDDQVYYRLVPQKKNAHVFFEVNMKSKDGNSESDVLVGDNDEFLVFTKNLTYYTDKELGELGKTKECDFLNNPVSSTMGSGYFQAFKPIRSEKSKYNIYMKTERTKSAEVIRIASPEAENEALFPPNAGQPYSGQYFRSITFELANYDPFKFNASVTNSNGEETLQWTYDPEMQVNVELDVTSFRGSDNRSADPFGTPFKVYINAPMLQIDESRRGKYDGQRFYEESEGVFVLKINAKRDENRLGNDNVTVTDKKGSNIIEGYPADDDADQRGEHHVLPFKKKGIVSEGEIEISSEQDIVNFNTEKLIVTNSPINGSITFDGEAVPANEFVSCSLKKDGTRIGVININTDGNYELRLRQSYNYNWLTDSIVLTYKNGTNVYKAEFINLRTLFNTPDVELKIVP